MTVSPKRAAEQLLSCLLTNLTDCKAVLQRQSVRKCEITCTRRLEGLNTQPQILRVNGQLPDLAMAPLQEHAHSMHFPHDINVCRQRGRKVNSKLFSYRSGRYSFLSVPLAGLAGCPSWPREKQHLRNYPDTPHFYGHKDQNVLFSLWLKYVNHAWCDATTQYFLEEICAV